MQSQHNSNNNNNSYLWTSAPDMVAAGTTEDNLELFAHLSSIANSSSTAAAVTNPTSVPYAGPSYDYNATATNNNQEFGNSLDLFYQNHQQQFQEQQEANIFSMVAPLASPPTSELIDAVSRMNMDDQTYQDRRQQRMSLSSTLSLDIQPFISITEPTPVHYTMPSLRHVDQFIAQHSQELNQNQLQQQYQQQQQQQQQDNFSQLMDPNSFLDDLLIAQSGTTDWLSWTPARGSSPVSINSNSFDDQSSLYSTSPEPNALYYNMMMASEEVLGSSSAFGTSYPSQPFVESTISNNNTLTVKKANRSRRVSEPPKPSSSIIQEQQLTNAPNTDRPIRRSNSDHRRSRSNSNSSTMMAASSTPGNHICLHLGCGKSFARLYNLTSHQKIHSNDRPFACSQCGRKFARQHDRNRHEKLHWGIKPYACMHCKKPFARMDALNRHLRVENGCSTHINNNTNNIVDNTTTL